MRIAICDDDVRFLDQFEKKIIEKLESYTANYEICKFTNGASMLAIHKQAEFDVVFLDIDMPVESGLSVAREFRNSFDSVYIIFVTNHSNYVYDSFDVQPFNYIMKTNNHAFEDKLNSVFKLLFNHMKQNQTIIIDDNKLGNISLSYKEIVFIESRKHYCIFHIKSHKTAISVIKVRKSIGDLEEELKDYDFIRVQKKYIVNLSHVISMDKNNHIVNLRNDVIVKLGPTYKQKAEVDFLNYLRKH